MRKLAIGLSLAVLFLIGCEWVSDNVPHPDLYGTQAARAEADLKHPPTTLITEGLNFPKHQGNAPDALKFEIEFSDGTKAGCIYIWSGVSCVKLGTI